MLNALNTNACMKVFQPGTQLRILFQASCVDLLYYLITVISYFLRSDNHSPNCL